MLNIVKKLRGNLTQKELSKLTGIAQSTLAEYELGRFPKPDQLNKIAAAVGKKVKIIIEDADPEEKKIERRKASFEEEGCYRCIRRFKDDMTALEISA